jgi:hypothetical protein
MLAGRQKVEQADRLGERQKERDKKHCPDGQILTSQVVTRSYCHIQKLFLLVLPHFVRVGRDCETIGEIKSETECK